MQCLRLRVLFLAEYRVVMTCGVPVQGWTGTESVCVGFRSGLGTWHSGCRVDSVFVQMLDADAAGNFILLFPRFNP